ncbi:unnamed protein product [Rotaria sordida]|uniref:NAD(P)(+)--arginine ADP-ribosyltransferase n=1 Tax=Rotaria sordida TaxID=392033 RepID=A0A815EBQ6_9BILA|nr:unnamed protein product [Rotaria sordida]CAF1579623.1 unnamed protein product [Rotaria sordida]
MTQFKLSLTKLDEIQNHDDFRVVWFSSDNNLPNELAHFVDYLEKYDSFETCCNYIQGFQSDRIIILVLIDFFEYLSYFNNLFQIQSIYVMQRNPQNMQYEEQEYSKLVNIFTDEQTLIERLRHDILLTYRHDLPITISRLHDIRTEQSLMSLDKNEYTFLWNQAFIHYLVSDSNVDMNELKKNMIEQCQLEYSNNQIRLKSINDFDENCTYDHVLKWYTGDSFVYRLVNRSFRTRNIDLICKFRYFIILLYKKLKELSIKQQKEKYSTFYRGQILGKNDLENLESNIGRLISMHTLMSTSRKEDVARKFISGAEVGVIFEINTISASDNILHPFADISQLSVISDEEEILFFAGAVFRINSVQKENDSTWIIKLTLCNETVEQLEQFIDGVTEQLTSITCWDHYFMKRDDWFLFRKYYKILTGKKNLWKDLMAKLTSINFYYLCVIFGDYEKVIEYYRELLHNEEFIDDQLRIVVNILIGYNYYHLFQFDNALYYYNIAFSSLDDNNLLRGELYIRIGDVWRIRNNVETALSCYKKALEIFINQDAPSRDVARLCRKVFDIYLEQNNYEDAIIYQEQADIIDDNYRQESEFDIETSLKYFQNQLDNQSDHSPLQRANTLYSMGLCFMKKNNYSQALKNLLQAKELFEKHVTSYNNFRDIFSSLFESIALVYALLKDNFNALIMLKKLHDVHMSFNSD